MHSYNTQLDNHDCASLLPNGDLILNTNKETNEKIPIECIKKTSKSIDYEKYGFPFENI